MSQAVAVASRTVQRIQPSASVPTPTYFSPEAKTTNVITGLM